MTDPAALHLLDFKGNEVEVFEMNFTDAVALGVVLWGNRTFSFKRSQTQREQLHIFFKEVNALRIGM